MDNLSFGDLLGSLWGISLVAIFFGGSIFVHELGHFLAARKRGLKIERFSIGFGPRLFGWTGKDGVDYRVSIIPLGGYVALPQLAEMEGIEGASSEEAEKLPKISYADKMIVSVMGAVFNVIFAFVLACVLWVIGMPVGEGTSRTVIGYVPEHIVVGDGFLAELGLGNPVDGPAYKAGLRPGDKVLSVDDNSVSSFTQIQEAVLLGNRKNSKGDHTATFKVERGGIIKEFLVKPVQREINRKSGDAMLTVGISPKTEVKVAQIIPGGPAEAAGLKAGDQVISVDGKSINHFAELQELLRKGGSKPKTLHVKNADGKEADIVVTPKVNTQLNPVGLITYGEAKQRRSLVLLPTTKDLTSQDQSLKKDQLIVFGISPEDPALAETLKIGTIIDKVDGRTQITSVRSLEDLEKVGAGVPRDLTVYWRRANGDAGNLTMSMAKVEIRKAPESGEIGIIPAFKTERIYPNPIETCSTIIKSTFTTLSRLFDRNSEVKVKHLASVISITKTYVRISNDIERVLWFTVLINLNLAVLNLLPIPVLDGGHMLIATIQRFTKGVLSNKAVIILQYTFMGLLLSLMAYIILHDVRRCSGDSENQLRQQLFERHMVKQQDFGPTKK